MRIGLVGWGVETQSAYRYFGSEHDYLIVNEHPRDDFPAESEKIKVQFIKSAKPAGITSNVSDTSYLEDIDTCDRIIYSVTSIKNLEKIFGEKEDFWKKATTVNHIFFENVKTKNIIGVTGSKGKGTTSTLIAKMLEAAGKNVHLGGNIGRGVLDFINDVERNDWVVLELTSFQLYKFPYSPYISVCLMITKEHQDWHDNMEEYIEAKSNLFAHQKEYDIAIYFAGNQYSKEIASKSKGVKIPYFEKPGAFVREDSSIVVGQNETEVLNTSDLKILGQHNWQNVCAAITATYQITQNVIAMRQVLSVFSGLEHRLELVRELDGVKYYDDSFGTTPETAVVAMRAFQQPKVLILGGVDKGLDFEPLVEEIIKGRIRHVITIGTIGPKIEHMLREKGFNNITPRLDNMEILVGEAHRLSRPGDIVLLSPASSSLDMFKDYKERGDKFKEAVLELS